MVYFGEARRKRCLRLFWTEKLRAGEQYNSVNKEQEAAVVEVMVAAGLAVVGRKKYALCHLRMSLNYFFRASLSLRREFVRTQRTSHGSASAHA